MSARNIIFGIWIIVSAPFLYAQSGAGINKKTLAQYIKEEKQQGSARIVSDEDMKPVSKELDQVVFIRPDATLPGIDLVIRYIFFKKDSVIAEIRDEWDLANHNKKINNPQNLSFRTRMADFYRKQEIYLTNQFGSGKTSGTLPEVIHPDSTYMRSVSWLFPTTKIRLEIVMQNTFDPERKIYPEHKVILSLRDVVASNRMKKYKDKEWVERIRVVKPYIDMPIKGASVPLLPGCDDPAESHNCMNSYIAKQLEEKIRTHHLHIGRDKLRLSFRVNRDGTVSILDEPSATSVELKKIGAEVIKELPRFRPAYNKKLDQNVAAGFSLLFYIKNNKVHFDSFRITPN